MPDINWTPSQREAIEEVGRSVVVSAAAGSGKTAVLAERCAYLVCDAPAPHRCAIDRLLVVTFAEDAAAEMKDRIRANFQDRLRQAPRDPHLREQLVLLDTAAISTLHSFCNTLIHRWFNKVDIDPAAPLLPEDEGRILKADTLDALFERLYESDDPAGQRFRDLVDTYGLGHDDAIRRSVRQLADYLNSLPDPDGWLADARDRLGGDAERLQTYVIRPLRREVWMQRTNAEQAARSAETGNRFDAFYGGVLADYADQLSRWHDALDRDIVSLDDFDSVRREIESYNMSARGAPRVKKGDDTESERRDAAKRVFDTARKHFQDRLRDRFARFTPDETLQGLDRIQPFVATLAELSAAFRDAYQAAKRRLGLIDFSDQERFAYRLLQDAEVAATLRDRFDHILVDEYQDISPLQDAILRRVSREDQSSTEANLFTVGDVKQSIYGFRAAEPDVFRDRIERSEQDPARSHTIHLRKNFRSRPRILEAVNLLFERLMRRAVGGIDYDDDHALNPAREAASDARHAHVDVHLLEDKGPTFQASDDASQSPTRVDPDDPAEWEAIEREAFVIGTQIRRLMSAGMKVNDGRALELGDIAVLLRSASHTADRLASFLVRLGLNAHSRAAAAARDTTEQRDVRALLHVLDNTRQDIPLAAVLRSPILGLPINEDDLLAVRRLDRDVPFHETVRGYAERGHDPRLRERVRSILDRVAALRDAARQQPVADLVRRVLHDFGYLAYVGGLSDGDRRRRNLLWFHDRARQFGGFRNQGLRRFIDYLDALDADGGGLGAAPHGAQASDAVQIMTIHGSKGLEFPVVFVADLGRRFNLSDKRGRIIFDRGAGVGLRVIDRDQMIEYPSAAHHLVTAAVDRRTRAEELRLLYVAMTRAKEKLFLIGRSNLGAIDSRRCVAPGAPNAVTPLDVESAATPADWILAALTTLAGDQVRWSGDPPHRAPRDVRFHVHTHSADEMAGWHIERPPPREITPTQHAVAALEPLPPDEPRSADPKPAETTLDRLSFVYPHLPVCSVRAIVAAGEVKHMYDHLHDPEEQFRDPTAFNATQSSIPGSELQFARTPPNGADPIRARRRGTATHAVLQHIHLAAAADPAGVTAELKRLIAAGLLAEPDASLVDTAAVAWFAATPLGRAARDAGDAYFREFMFIAAHPAAWFDDGVQPDENERVLVRGVVDGVLKANDHTEVIDFKTDIVTSAETAERAERYLNQLKLYAASVAPIFQQPVTRAWLVFLHARRVVPVPLDP